MMVWGKQAPAKLMEIVESKKSKKKIFFGHLEIHGSMFYVPVTFILRGLLVYYEYAEIIHSIENHHSMALLQHGVVTPRCVEIHVLLY